MQEGVSICGSTVFINEQTDVKERTFRSLFYDISAVQRAEVKTELQFRTDIPPISWKHCGFSCWKSTGITHRNEAINIVLCCRRMMHYVQPKVDLSSSRHSYVKVTWCHVITRAQRCSATELVIWSSTRDRQTDIQCESKKSPPWGVLTFFIFSQTVENF